MYTIINIYIYINKILLFNHYFICLKLIMIYPHNRVSTLYGEPILWYPSHTFNL